MNTFLGSGIILFVLTVLFAIFFFSILDSLSLQAQNNADNVIYVNSALWILSIILSSIGMKKRRDSKREDELRKEKSEINLTRVDKVVTEQDEEIKKLKEKGIHDILDSKKDKKIRDLEERLDKLETKEKKDTEET